MLPRGRAGDEPARPHAFERDGPIQSANMTVELQLTFVPRACCQLCEDVEKIPVDSLSWLGYHFVWVACGRCGLIYMDPVPDTASYVAFYQQAFWDLKTGGSKPGSALTSGPGVAAQARRQRRHRVPRIEALLASSLRGCSRPPPRVLEIGCSWGESLAYLAARYGAQVHGIEPSALAQHHLAHRHPEIVLLAGSLEELYDDPRHDGTMDVVIASHCLENISDQNAALATIHRLLASNGVLYLDTPSFYWNLAQNPYHPFIYTPASLTAMLAKHGFAIRRMKTTPPPAHHPWRAFLTFLLHRDEHLAVLASKGGGTPPATEMNIPATELAARQRTGRAAVERYQRLRNLPRRLYARARPLHGLYRWLRRP